MAVFVVVVVSAHVQADDKSDEKKPSLFSLTELDAFFEFEGDFAHREVDSTLPNNGRPFRRERSQSNEQWTLEERLGLRFSGTLISPKTMTFGGTMSFGLSQNRFEERGFAGDRTDTDRGYLLEYDLRMNLFPGEKFSGSVYGRRVDNRINRAFQPTLRERVTAFGTSWYYADEQFPMELRYDYRETDRTNNTREIDDEHYTDSIFYVRQGWNIDDGHKVDFSYEHGNIKQAFQGADRSFETTRDLFIINHELRFGNDKQHLYRTLVHWQEESGDFARDLFEIGPQLILQHTDNLQTMYKYQFNRERYEGLDVETQRADFQIVHQMYSNLTTTFDVFGLYEDVEDDINTTQYGALVDWQYNRRNRWGHFYANLALSYDTEEIDGDDGRRIVLDESIALRDPVPVELRNANVQRDSIVVTDTTNRRLFRPGIDYAILQRGNATLIDRLPGGLIANGDTVLVDYQIATPQRGQLDTLRVDFSLEQRFTNGLRPYYRLSYRNQEDDTSEGFLRRADRTNHHRIGLIYDQDRYSLGAEYEVYDDPVERYHGFHLNGRVDLLRDVDQTVAATARFSRLFFDGEFDRRNVSLLNLQLDHRWRISDAWSTVERLAYRLEDDSIDGTTHSWDVTAGLEYALGDLTCSFTFEYDRLDLPQSEEDNFGVFVRFRRDFPNVLARR